jgi:putative hydrolase of the HAD superfamily
MRYSVPNTTLFLEIGDVMLSNGWRHEPDIHADLPLQPYSVEMDDQLRLNRITREQGKLTLSEYLNRVVFFKKRSSTSDQFREFMYTQTTPNSEMIDFLKELEEHYKLKITLVNNEGTVLNEYRIKKFRLNQFVDFFISSCFVHTRKPDTDVFRLALDIEQVPVEQVVDIEDLKMFVDVAGTMGIRSVRHKNYLSTSDVMSTMGLMLG